MIFESEIGKKIREYRKQKGITLNHLAKKTGLTKGYLSKIEKSKKAPPVSTLILIIKALGISISEIFEEQEDRISISLVKNKERQVIARNGSTFGYAYHALAHKFPKKHMEPYIITLPINPKQKACFQHKGEEMVFVLEGTMRFFHGDKEFIVRKGDCIYFDSNVPHYGISDGKKEVKCLTVIYTPD